MELLTPGFHLTKSSSCGQMRSKPLVGRSVSFFLPQINKWICKTNGELHRADTDPGANTDPTDMDDVACRSHILEKFNF